MSDNHKKSRLHIHIFRLFLIIALIWVLLQINVKTVVESPQLQENVSYVKEQSVTIWQKYLAKPVGNAWNNLLKNLVNRGIDQVQEKINSNFDEIKQ